MLGKAGPTWGNWRTNPRAVYLRDIVGGDRQRVRRGGYFVTATDEKLITQRVSDHLKSAVPSRRDEFCGPLPLRFPRAHRRPTAFHSLPAMTRWRML